jgi:hypothetical protein
MASFPGEFMRRSDGYLLWGLFQAELSLVRPAAVQHCSAPAGVISKPFFCNKNVAKVAFRPLYFALYWNVVDV